MFRTARIGVIVAVGASSLAVSAVANRAGAAVPPGWQQGTAAVTHHATSVLATSGLPPAAAPDDNSFPGDTIHPFARGLRNGPQDHLPTPASTAVSTAASGFDGITALQQRVADGNHQPNVAPPDQALCVGNGFVVEAVNVAVRVFSTGGTPLTDPVSLGPFMGDGHEVISRHPFTLGPLHSDPRCLFDSDTGRFYLTSMRFLRDASHGFRDVGPDAVEVAVSRTGDPRGTWDIYAIDVTADGDNGSPALSGCPCLGDFPVLGADAYGIYVTTAEFSIAAMNANSATQLVGERFHALSKRQLAAGVADHAVTFTSSYTGVGPFPVLADPATTPPGGAYDLDNGGTEYLTADCLNLNGQLLVFALTNTSSLDGPKPALSLSQQLVATEPTVPGLPFPQRDGTRPLATWIQQQTGGAEPPLELVDNGVDCTQLVYADGRLWTARTTEVKPPNGPPTDGIAWFQIVPAVRDGQVSGVVAKQGYVVIDRNNAVLGSVAVDRTGRGVLAFDVFGPDYHPSSAYVHLDEKGAGPATIFGVGAVPLDNFDGYQYFGARAPVARFGDYSAAVTAGDGDYWIATEYLPDVPRSQLAHWSTRIAEVR